MKITIKKTEKGKDIYFWAHNEKDNYIANTCVMQTSKKTEKECIEECINLAKEYLTPPKETVVKEVEI